MVEELSEESCSRCGMSFIEKLMAGQTLDDIIADTTPAAEVSIAMCSICLDPLDTDREEKTLVCGHRFHTTCVDKWLEEHTSCPMCRQTIPVAEERPDLIHGGHRSQVSLRPAVRPVIGADGRLSLIPDSSAALHRAIRHPDWIHYMNTLPFPDDGNRYHEDLCARVFNNELILAKVFGHLSLRQLFQCCLVCHKWHSEATRVATNRSQSLNICHLFHADHPSQDTDLSLIRDPTGGDGDMADDSMDYCSRVHWVERYDFKANVIRSMTADLRSVPAVCLLVYGSLGEDVKLAQRLYHTEILRRYLPRSDCLVVNLNSQCLIGAPTTSSVPIHKITHFGDLAAVSLLLLPKYKPGVDVTVFSGADMRQKVFTRP
ncbi:unnamed protein product, partial [Medioppia subpectinata]